MAGKAKFRQGYGNKLKDQTINIKTLYSLSGSKSTPTASTMSFGVAGGSASPPSIDEYAKLKTMGDSMIGAIAYTPKSTIISNGEIDVAGGDAGSTTDNYTSYLIVAGQGNANDDLVTIANPTHAGQILNIQAIITTDITLKHNTGNIYIPSGSDHTISAGDTASLIWDITVHANKWVLLSSGGGGWSGDATSDLDMNTYDIIDVDRLQFTKDSGAGKTNSKVEMYANSNTPEDAIINHPEDSYFRFTENGQQYLTISNNSQDGIMPVSSGSMSLGSATKLWGGINTEQITVYGGGSGINGTQIGLNMATSGGQVGVHCGGSANNGAWTSIWDGLEDLGRSGNYWKDLYIHEIQIKDTSANPTTNGQFTRNGNDVKVYTGGGVKNLSDIGSGGGSGANTALSNLDTTTALNATLRPTSDNAYDLGTSAREWKNLWVDGTGNIDTIISDQITVQSQFYVNGTCYLNGTVNLGNSSGDDIDVEGKLDFRSNTGSSGASSAGTYNGNILSPQGYIGIHIGGSDYTIPYYST